VAGDERKRRPERAEEVRRLLEEDRVGDLSGTRPFQDATGAMHSMPGP